LPSEKKTLNTNRVIGLVNLLTIHCHSHIMDKAADDLEGLRCGYPSLVLGESVEPLEYRLDVLLSKGRLNKLFCVALNQLT
jgi:hypothetical protein